MMLTPQQIIDSEYLESRCALLEIAAVLDRHDTAVNRTGKSADNTELNNFFTFSLLFNYANYPTTLPRYR